MLRYHLTVWLRVCARTVCIYGFACSFIFSFVNKTVWAIIFVCVSRARRTHKRSNVRPQFSVCFSIAVSSVLFYVCIESRALLLLLLQTFFFSGAPMTFSHSTSMSFYCYSFSLALLLCFT